MTLTVIFIDETQRLASGYDSQPDHEQSSTPGLPVSTPTKLLSQTEWLARHASHFTERDQSFDVINRSDSVSESILEQAILQTNASSEPAPGPPHIGSPSDLMLMHPTTRAINNSIGIPPITLEASRRRNEQMNSLKSQIYLDRPVWPLTKLSEALLLRHFAQNLATWVNRLKQTDLNQG